MFRNNLKRILILLMIGLILIFLIVSIKDYFLPSINKRISKSIGIKIPNSINIDYKDNHGGLNGDGETVAIIHFDAIDADIISYQISNSNNWNQLPLSKNLDRIMYKTESSKYNLSELLSMPKIENGYWFFNNRHHSSTDSKNDYNLFGQSSFNFTVAIYDIDTNILYYLEFDT